jgi:hypothetical protein
MVFQKVYNKDREKIVSSSAKDIQYRYITKRERRAGEIIIEIYSAQNLIIVVYL